MKMSRFRQLLSRFTFLERLFHLREQFAPQKPALLQMSNPYAGFVLNNSRLGRLRLDPLESRDAASESLASLGANVLPASALGLNTQSQFAAPNQPSGKVIWGIPSATSGSSNSTGSTGSISVSTLAAMPYTAAVRVGQADVSSARGGADQIATVNLSLGIQSPIAKSMGDSTLAVPVSGQSGAPAPANDYLMSKPGTVDVSLIATPVNLGSDPSTMGQTWGPIADTPSSLAVVSPPTSPTTPQIPMQGASPPAGSSVTLTATIRDFREKYHQIAPDINTYYPDPQGSVDFGNWDRGGGQTNNLLSSTLNSDGTPSYIGPNYTPQNPEGGIDSAASFNQWYHDVPGVNLSTQVALTVPWTNDTWGYQYNPSSFFPIDGQLFGNSGTDIYASSPQREVWHNYGFTTQIQGQIEFENGKYFSVTGDDDIWVYINNKLAIDLGGMHPPSGTFVYLDNLQSQLGLVAGNKYSLSIFHAERRPGGSVVNFGTNCNLFAASPPVVTANISGMVFVDSNWNGKQDSGESGYSNAVLTLKDTNNNIVGTTTTQSNGNYQFNSIPVGDYSLIETLPNGYSSSTSTQVRFYLPASGRTDLNFGLVNPGDGWTWGQSGGSANLHGSVNFANNGTFQINEGDSFTVWAQHPLVAGSSPTTVTIQYTNLNQNASSGIKDAFEVAVVDAKGNPLADTFTHTNRDSQANLTQGETSVGGGSTRLASGTIQVDLSGIAAGTQGTLRVREVSNNRTGNSSVTISGVRLGDAVTPKFYVADATSGLDFQYNASGSFQKQTGLGLGSNDPTPKGITSNLLGTRQWVIDGKGLIRVYDPSGYQLGSWQATGLDGPEDITTNGADIWVVDRTAGKMARYANGASMLTGSMAPSSTFSLAAGNADATGVVTDGSSLWVSDRSTRRVYVYGLEGSTHGNWAYDNSLNDVTGITLDPTNASNDLWLVDRTTSSVYRYPNARALTSGSLGFDTPSTFRLAAGNQAAEGIADPTSGSVPTNAGTDFWLTFPEVRNSGDNTDQLLFASRKLELQISSDQDSTGTISIPGLNFNETFSVLAGNVTQIVNLPTTAAMKDPSANNDTLEQIKTLGIHVVASNPVTLQAIDYIPTASESFLALPTNVSGQEYIVATHGNLPPNQVTDIQIQNSSAFQVVATQDNTIVTITLAADTGTHHAGVPYQITLNQGQVYQLKNITDGVDLTGSIITSDKPINVIGSHGELTIPGLARDAANPLTEELNPTSAWGTHYLTEPLAGRAGDPIRVLACQDGTVVYLNGSMVASLNRGQFYETLLTSASDIRSNLPVQVVQYSRSYTADHVAGTMTNVFNVTVRPDPSMSQVPSTDQYLSRYTFSSLNSFALNIINLVVPTDSLSALRLDGAPLDLTPFSAIGTSGYSGAQIPIANGTHVLTGSEPFGMIQYGYDDYDSYSNPAGLAFNNLKIAIDSPTDQSSYPIGTKVLITGHASSGLQADPITRVTMNGVPVDGLDASGRFFQLVTIGSGTNVYTFTAYDQAGKLVTIDSDLLSAAPVTRAIDFSTLVSSSSIVAEYHRTSLNDQSNTLYTDVDLKNQGTYALDTPLVVVLNHLSDPSVVPTNADGITPDGRYYWDFSQTVSGTTLATGSSTGSRTLAFSDPNRRQFQYSLQVLGRPNAAPVFTTVPNLNVIAGKSYSYQAMAIDPNSDPVSYSLTQGPAGLTLSTGTAGLLQWNTQSSDVGNYGIEITASDGRGGISRQAFTLSVQSPVPNRPPVFLSTPVLLAYVNAPYSYQAVASDADGNPINYSGSGPFSVPSSGLIQWTPTADQVGTYTVNLTASDGQGGTASQVYTLQVLPVPGNHPPRIVSTPPSTTVTGVPLQYQVVAVDPDRDPLHFAITSPPISGLSIDATTGLLSWNAPVSNQSITVRVSDGRGGFDAQTFSLQVNTSNASVSGHVYQDANSDGSYEQGEPLLAHWVVFVDQNGNGQLDTGELKTTTDANGNYHFIGLPRGVDTIRVIHPDGWVGYVPSPSASNVTISTSQEAITGLDFGFVPQAINQPPTFTNGPPTNQAVVGTSYTFTLTATDLEHDPLTYDLPVAPAGMSIDPVTGVILWTPTSNQIGTQSVLARVSEPGDRVALLQFTISVNASSISPPAPNAPPKITSTPLTQAYVSQVYTYALRTQDAENDPIQFGLLSAPAGMSISQDGVIRWTPTSSQLGGSPYTVKVTANDPGGTTEQDYQLTLSVVSPPPNSPPVPPNTPPVPPNSPPPPNRAPVFAPVSSGYWAAGQPYAYQTSATDPDGDSITYTVASSPSISGLAIDSTGKITWANPVSGTYKITAYASDGSLTSYAYYYLQVRVNHAPVIAPASGLSVIKGQTFQFDVQASDADNDPISYQVSGPSGLTIDSLGRVLWTTTGITPANYNFTVTATDNYGASGTQTFTVAVVADTTPPVVAIEDDNSSIAINKTVHFHVTASDDVGVASTALQVSLNGGTPVNLTLDANGYASYTPTQTGSLVATASATDTSGNVSTPATASVQVFDPTVNVPQVTFSVDGVANDAELFQPASLSGSVSSSVAVTWQVDYLAADGTSTLVGAQGTGTISGELGRVLDPTLLPDGTYTVRLTATNAGGSANASQVVRVEGHLKIGNLQLSATDLTIPVAGIPITVGRHYDSIYANTKQDFGYGWKLDFGGYTTEVDPTTTDPFGNFIQGTRVTVRDSSGQGHSYLFEPRQAESFSAYYIPAFVPEDPTGNSLELVGAESLLLSKVTDTEFLIVDSSGNLDINPKTSPLNLGYVITEAVGGLETTIDGKTNQTVSIKNRNGSQLNITPDGITSNRGRTVTFERDYLGRIDKITDPRGNSVRYAYDSKGNLQTVTDRLGDVSATYGYLSTPAHYLQSVTDANGVKVLQASYDSNSKRLSSLVDAVGNPVNLSYNITDPANSSPIRATQTVTIPGAGAGGANLVTTTSADARGNVVQSVDALGHTVLTAFTDTHNPDSPTQVTQVLTSSANLVTQTTYDSKTGLPTSTTSPGGEVTRNYYNTDGTPSATVNPLGDATTTAFDSKGNLLATTSPEGISSSFAYDSKGNLTSTTRGSITSSLTYDSLGQVTTSTSPTQINTNFSYDANGNQTGNSSVWVDPNNSANTKTLTSTTTFDAADRAIASTDTLGNTTQTGYDRAGHAITSIDPHGNVTTTKHDARGLTVEVDNPDGTITQTVYDSQGRAIYSTDPVVAGQVTRGTHTSYDDLGRTVETDRVHGLIISVSTSNGISTSAVSNPGIILSQSLTHYNEAGQVDYSIQYANSTAAAKTAYQYDADGRQISVQTFLDAGFSKSSQTSTTYDAAGRATVQIDAAGIATTQTYDGDGRVTKVTTADGAWVSTAYDSQGRKASTTALVDLITGETQTTAYGYDTNGRLISITQAAVADPNHNGAMTNPVTLYGFDAYGNQTSITDANGHQTTFAFDAYGRQLSRTLPSLSGVNGTESTFYDSFGNVDYTLDFNGTKTQTIYDYDLANSTKLGRVDHVNLYATGQSTPQEVISYQYDAYGRKSSVADWNASTNTTRTTSYNYDIEGNVVQISAPEGVIHYGYDATTNRHTKTWTANSEWDYIYDTLGRLQSVEDVNSGITTNYTYDILGNVLITVSQQGSSTLEATTNTYDSQRHWLVGIANKDGNGNTLSTFSYTRRADGQMVEVDEQVKQPNNSMISTTSKYTHDSIDRLTKEAVTTNDPNSGSYTTTYTLDLVGNRLSKVQTGANAQTVVSSYNARDELTQDVVTGGSNPGTISYGYDANGSLITQSGAGSTQTQNWDLQGRLSGATVNGVSTSYTYNADGIRSSVTENGNATQYLVDGMTPSGYAQVVEELPSGVFAVRYAYGPSSDPISESRNGTTSLYLGDGHNGVRQAMNRAGAVVLTQRFDAFGNTIAKTGTLQTPVGYGGERFDSTLGQYYLRARYYNPQQGRFTGVDPFGGNYSDPLQLMRYGYAGNNPIANRDPSGRESLGSLAVQVGTIGGLVGAVSGGIRGAKYGWKGAIAGFVVGGVIGFVSGYLLTLAIGSGSAFLAGRLAANPAMYTGLYNNLLSLGLMQATFVGLGIAIGRAAYAYDKGDKYEVAASVFEAGVALLGIGSLTVNPVSTNAPFYPQSKFGAEAMTYDVLQPVGMKPSDFFDNFIVGGREPEFSPPRTLRLPSWLFNANTSQAVRAYNLYHELGHSIQLARHQRAGTEQLFWSYEDGSPEYAKDEIAADTFAYLMVRYIWGAAAAKRIHAEYQLYMELYSR